MPWEKPESKPVQGLKKVKYTCINREPREKYERPDNYIKVEDTQYSYGYDADEDDVERLEAFHKKHKKGMVVEH